MLPRVPLALPKLLTQVNQLHLSVWWTSREISHIGDPLRMSAPPRGGHRLFMFHLMLYNRSS